MFHMAKLKKQHMTIHWKAIVQDDSSIPATEATLKEKATLVGRVGLMMLSVGTGAWRVRNSMNKVARCLGITCTADIGLLAISYTCIEGTDTYTQSISNPTTGVNTHKLMELELFMKEFPDKVSTYSVKHIHEVLDEIQKLPANYKAWNLGLASALACGAFTFLLGGGPVEMCCAFLGAGVGNFVRKKMLGHSISLLANVAVSVAASCLCPYHPAGTKSVVCIGSPSGWLHLCDAVCHSGISADYGRYRPCKTRFAVGVRTSLLCPAHHPNSNHDWLGNGCHLSLPTGRL